MELESKRGALEAYLAQELELPGPCRIVEVVRIAMGQSRAMYRLEIEYEGPGETSQPQRRHLMLRVEQWGLLGSDGGDEVRIMRALHAMGYPVARILAAETSNALLGQPFFVMEFAPGSSVFIRESLDEYVRALDRLHRIDPGQAGLDFLAQPQAPRDAARFQVERWYEVYRRSLVGEPSPLLEEAAQWLRNHAPESRAIGIVHGDPGPGNYLHQNGTLSCVVDWEFTHIGDPDEDWAYLISMRGMGVMAEDAWLRYLREEIGLELEPARLRYWQAFNFFKGACIDQTALAIYVHRKSPAPNLLAIGTAVHLMALKQLGAAIEAA